jgi:hypothetical protein
MARSSAPFGSDSGGLGQKADGRASIDAAKKRVAAPTISIKGVLSREKLLGGV